jgi:hypothetical protein
VSARLRPVLAAAVVLAIATTGLVSAASAGSKPVPLTVTDVADDANGLNDQFGLLPAAPEQSNGAVSQKSADILSFTLGRKDVGGKPKAFVGTMTLAAPPAQGTDYRIRMTAPGCTTYFLEYEYAPALDPAGEVRHTCDGGTSAVFEPVDVTVTGSTITWTIPIKGMPGGLKMGTPLSVKGAQTSVETVAIIPGLDQVRVDKTFVIGQ